MSLAGLELAWPREVDIPTRNAVPSPAVTSPRPRAVRHARRRPPQDAGRGRASEHASRLADRCAVALSESRSRGAGGETAAVLGRQSREAEIRGRNFWPPDRALAPAMPGRSST
ncbi:hypothetical protein PsYK624_171820 [Phanerochaete sordida]|uniref:Uncharacterized protein n=1 Tax=Phanerochaete sordida TaxID=48140 RepID=A0A9P3GYZ8_9APHY|nr:hypothetical protein PsYK624_171820 [Phanerochaete sordida]